MLPLWFKAFHLIFMVTWFAGLFYLPRLFIYHSQAQTPTEFQRFEQMETRLFAIMSIGASLTLVFGLLTLSSAMFVATLGATWFKIKLVCVFGLLWHHYLCWRWIQRLRADPKTLNERWLRLFNEIPAIYLFAIILLATIRPF